MQDLRVFALRHESMQIFIPRVKFPGLESSILIKYEETYMFKFVFLTPWLRFRYFFSATSPCLVLLQPLLLPILLPLLLSSSLVTTLRAPDLGHRAVLVCSASDFSLLQRGDIIETRRYLEQSLFLTKICLRLRRGDFG